MKDFKESVVSGAKWMLSMRFTVQAIGLLSSIILARILVPEDFGLVALAGSAYAFFAVIGQFGFDQALIQHKDPTPAHYDAAWTANILVGLFIAIGMLFVGQPAADFFGDPRIESVVYAFAALSVAKGFENIGVVNFRKNLQFKGDFLYFVLPKLTSLLVAVPAALVLESYWALVCGMVAMQFASLVYSHLSQPFRPKLSIRLIGELLQFSRWILLSSIIGYLSYHGVTILLGKIGGSHVVGLFGIAFQIAALTSSELIGPINRSLFPSFSSISNDLPRLSSVLTKIYAMTLLLALPAAFGVVAISHDFIHVVLGENWSQAAPALAVLSLLGVLRAVKGTIGPALLALGKPSIITKVKLLNLVLLYPAILYLYPKFGLVGVCYAFLLSEAAGTLVLLIVGVRELQLSATDMFRTSIRPTVAAATMLASLLLLGDKILVFGEPSLVGLIAKIVIGATVYVVTIGAMWQLMKRPNGPEMQLASVVFRKFAAT